MKTTRRIGRHSCVVLGLGATLAVTAVLGGCPSHPKPGPLTAPRVNLTVDYWAGDPLGGRGALPSEDVHDGKDAIEAHVELYSLEHPPEGSGLEPLEPRIRLITSVHGSAPFLPVPRALAGSGYATGDQAEAFQERLLAGRLGRFVRIGRLHAAVPAGVTAAFHIRGQHLDLAALDIEPLTDHLEILVHPRPSSSSPPASPSGAGSDEDGLALAVAVQTRNVSADDEVDSPGSTGPRPAVRESCQLDLRPAVGETIVFLVPTPLAETRSRMVAAFLRTRRPETPASPAFLAALRRCLECLSAGAVSPDQVVRQTAALEQERCDLEAALQCLAIEDKRRQGLIFLARLTGARLALESAFLLDDETVARIAEAILSKAKPADGRPPPGPPDAAAVGWLVERSAGEVLAAELSRPDAPIEIDGMLVRYAGEAGRHPGGLAAIFSDSEDLASLQAHLRQANLIFLDDHSLAARIRAADWMRRQGHAIEGYDPLGPRAQRREAIRRAEAATAAPSSTERSP